VVEQVGIELLPHHNFHLVLHTPLLSEVAALVALVVETQGLADQIQFLVLTLLLVAVVEEKVRLLGQMVLMVVLVAVVAQIAEQEVLVIPRPNLPLKVIMAEP
jgi:hypothetical protein